MTGFPRTISTKRHEAVAGSIARRIYVEIFRGNFNWLVPKTCLIKPLYAEATALRPDVVVLDKAELGSEPLWQKEPVSWTTASLQKSESKSTRP